jgi:DNA-3-methyladenine glycosylase II
LSRTRSAVLSSTMTSRRSSRLSGQNGITEAVTKAKQELKSVQAEVNTKIESKKPKSSRKRKPSQEIKPEDMTKPSTPKRRRKFTATADAAPPQTPTPATVEALTENISATPKKSKKTRRADPRATNAPLQTPGGSRVVKSFAAVDPLENLTPGRIDRGNIVTTDNLLEKACEHLCSIDPRLKPLIEKHMCKIFSPEGLAEEVDPFVALSSSIISQQVC